MQDFSHLDTKYFIDEVVYNCPFCNRKNVRYVIIDVFNFHWSEKKMCHGFIVQCSSCNNASMHLSYKNMVKVSPRYGKDIRSEFKEDIDSNIFYSVPTSFFVIDNRVPKEIRELITEAEGCLKMNFLTGASACARKAIYELTIYEACTGDNYEDKIKFLKEKFPNTDTALFDILSHIKDMTSDKVHEQSWPKWESTNLKLIIEALKAVLYDIYVIPKIKESRSHSVLQLLEKVQGKQSEEKTEEPEQSAEETKADEPAE